MLVVKCIEYSQYTKTMLQLEILPATFLLVKIVEKVLRSHISKAPLYLLIFFTGVTKRPKLDFRQNLESYEIYEKISSTKDVLDSIFSIFGSYHFSRKVGCELRKAP